MVVGSGGVAGSRAFPGIERTVEVFLTNISIHAVQKRSIDSAREKSGAGVAWEWVWWVRFGVS